MLTLISQSVRTRSVLESRRRQGPSYRAKVQGLGDADVHRYQRRKSRWRGTSRPFTQGERSANYRRDQMKGANPAGLSSMVSQHAGPAPAAGSSSASGSGAPAAPAEPGVVSIRSVGLCIWSRR
jgi:hypothetical protein